MGRPKHSSGQIRKVMEAFANDRQRWRYGYDLSREAGVSAGTLYPALSRLAADGLLEHRWELPQDGGRPRHCYRLTDEGVEFVNGFPAAAPAPAPVPVRRVKPRLNGFSQ